MLDLSALLKEATNRAPAPQQIRLHPTDFLAFADQARPKDQKANGPYEGFELQLDLGYADVIPDDMVPEGTVKYE